VTALYSIILAVISAGTAWAICALRACDAIARLKAQMREEIAHWQDETSRARAYAAQIARDTAIRADAWNQGRNDIIAVIPLITQAKEGRTHIQPSVEDGAEIT
jgi:hypothetical protein